MEKESQNPGDDQSDNSNDDIKMKKTPRMSSRMATAVTKINKLVTKHGSGVPIKLTNILGKIENISTGDRNSFATVRI